MITQKVAIKWSMCSLHMDWTFIGDRHCSCPGCSSEHNRHKSLILCCIHFSGRTQKIIKQICYGKKLSRRRETRVGGILPRQLVVWWELLEEKYERKEKGLCGYLTEMCHPRQQEHAWDVLEEKGDQSNWDAVIQV
jgi:hypothetical protein